jgi:DNA-binding SARP family transcriptional activator
MDPAARLFLLGGLRLERDGAPVAAVQRKRLAILAAVARAGPRGVSRERLLALFWPDQPPETARHALDVALSALRRALPDGALASRPLGVAVDPGRVAVDATEFEAALDAGDLAGAVGRYAGPFLDGVELPGAAEFGRWVEDERAVLARRHVDALQTLATGARAAGDRATAVRWAQAWAAAEPVGARAAAALVEALAAAGDLSAAARACRTHGTLVRQELGVDPDPSVGAALARARAVVPMPRPAHGPPPSPAGDSAGIVPSVAAEHAPNPAPNPAPDLAPNPATAPVDRPVELVPASRPPLDAPTVHRRRGVAALATLGLMVVFAAAVRGGAPGGAGDGAGAADPAPRAAAAWALYRLGMTATDMRDDAGAFRLFSAALAERPGFALAAARAAVTAPDESTRYTLYARAESLAVHAPLRDRLLVRTMVGIVTVDSARLAASDTLAARFPDDVAAMAARADLLMRTGRYATIIAEVAPLLRRAAARRDPTGEPVHDLYAALVESHRSLADFDGAERVAREWVARMPELPAPWDQLAHVLAARGRCAAADSAIGAPAMRGTALFGARRTFRLACEGDYAGATAELGERLGSVDAADSADLLWWRVIAERYAGQLVAADRDARALAAAPGGLAQHHILVGQVAMERGRPHEAAARFALAAERMTLRAREDLPPGLAGPRADAARAWGMTHVARALAAAGELERAAALADTVARLTRGTAADRGRVLPHYLRGVVLAARAERAASPAEAAGPPPTRHRRAAPGARPPEPRRRDGASRARPPPDRRRPARRGGRGAAPRRLAGARGRVPALRQRAGVPAGARGGLRLGRPRRQRRRRVPARARRVARGRPGVPRPTGGGRGARRPARRRSPRARARVSVRRPHPIRTRSAPPAPARPPPSRAGTRGAYPCRSAVSGSTRVARRTGAAHAASATAASSAAAPR